jgi:endo-1,4-beta-D-glucanase Y
VATRTNYVTTPRPGRNFGVFFHYGTIGTSFADGDDVRIDLPSAGDRGVIHPAITLSPGTYYASVVAQTNGTATNAAFVVKRTSDQALLLERHLTTHDSTLRIGGAFTLSATTQVELVMAQGAYSGLSQGSVWFRQILLEAATAEGTFFDGDSSDTSTVDYGWSGTPQNSISTAKDLTNTPPADPGSGATDTAIEAMVRAVWEGIKHRYIRADGGVMQKESDNKITSEGQGYAALQAVALGDWATFDQVEGFSTNVLERKNHPDPAVRAKGPNLMAWDYRVNPFGGNPSNTVFDWGWAADGDIDRIKALLWAYARTGKVAYLNKGLAVWRDLRDFSFNTVSGKSYQGDDQWQKSGPGSLGHHLNASSQPVMEINPSYLDPSTYHLVGDVGQDSFGAQAVLGAFDVWAKNMDNVNPLATAAGLPTNWTSWNLTTLQSSHFGPSPDGWSYDHGNDDNFGYDAFRMPIRAVWSYDWYKDPQVLSILGPLKAFYANEWSVTGKIAAEKDHAGNPLVGGYEGSIFYVAAMMVLTLNDAGNATAAAIKSSKFNAAGQYKTASDGYKYWADGPTAGVSSYFADFWQNFYFIREAGLWQNFGQSTPPTGNLAVEAVDDGTGDDTIDVIANGSADDIIDDGTSDDSIELLVDALLEVLDNGTSDDLIALLNDGVPTETESPSPIFTPIVSPSARWQWVAPDNDIIELTGFVDDYEAIKGMSGYMAPPSVIRRDTIPGQAGGRTRDVRHGVREIALPLFALGRSVLGLEILLTRLVREMDPWRGEGILRRIDIYGNVCDLRCRYSGGLEGKGSGENGPTNLRVMPVFQADDPYWYRAAVTQGFSGATARSFFPVLPIHLASSSVMGDIEIVTESDVETWPVWTVMGPGSNLIIKNNTSGETLSANISLASGEAIKIDTQPYVKRVVGPDGSNWFRFLVSRSLWPLLPGSNDVTLSMTGATSSSYVSVAYRDRTLVPFGGKATPPPVTGGGGGTVEPPAEDTPDTVDDLVEGSV